MPTCLETCNTGATVGKTVGGLTGVGLDLWFSLAYVRPFVDHLTNTTDRNEEIITGVIAGLALIIIVPTTMLMGTIAGPPTALALQGLYACGSTSLSALSKFSLFHPKNNQQDLNDHESLIQAPEEGERLRLISSQESMV